MRLTDLLRKELRRHKRTPNNWSNLSKAADIAINKQTFTRLLSNDPDVEVSGDTLDKLYELLNGKIEFGSTAFPPPRTGRPPKKKE